MGLFSGLLGIKRDENNRKFSAVDKSNKRKIFYNFKNSNI
jgi:hypothetical protein